MVKWKAPVLIGQITVKDGSVRVSDPSYDMNTWCATTISGLIPGQYNCYFSPVNIDWRFNNNNRLKSDRIGDLIILHVDHELYELKIDNSNIIDAIIGVDCGMCGIYDLDYFINSVQNNDIFYQKAIMKSTDRYADNSCVITSSGFGDGSYKAITWNNDSGIFAVRVVFLDGNENDSVPKEGVKYTSISFLKKLFEKFYS